MNNTSIAGRNIYTDKKNRILYYDYFSKNGFIIKQDGLSILYIYKNRFFIILLSVILVTDIISSWLIAIALTAGLLLMLEILFRRFYFSKLCVSPIHPNMKQKTLLTSLILARDPVKTLMKTILYFAFSILIVLNAYLQHASLMMYTLSIILSLAGLYYSVVHLLALIKISK